MSTQIAPVTFQSAVRTISDHPPPKSYFLTLLTHDRKCTFGYAEDGDMHLNETGKIIAEWWRWLARRYDFIQFDHWIVMPNHLQSIITIRHHSFQPAQLIQTFKSKSTCDIQQRD